VFTFVAYLDAVLLVNLICVSNMHSSFNSYTSQIMIFN